MPQLRFRAMDTNLVCNVSKEMIDELQDLLQCPRDYFSLELMGSTFIKDGEIVQGSPVVEVLWFDRGQEIQDKAAVIISKYMQSVGYSSIDVIFLELDKNRYYENGVHF